MANGSDSESGNEGSYSEYYQATGLSDVEARGEVDSSKVVSSEYSGPSLAKQANASTSAGVKRSDEIVGSSPAKEAIASTSGGVKRKNGEIAGPSPAKKAFLDSLAVPTDFSRLGKRIISQIVVGAAMKRSSFRGRLIMCVKGVSPVRKLQFLSLVFLDGTGEIRATF